MILNTLFRVAVCVTIGLAGAQAETIEFRSEREPLRGRVLVEFKAHLFVAVDRGSPQFVARAEIARILDEGGVPWVDPAPGTFARVLPGAPAAALTDTTLEVRIVQRGHRQLAGKQGPVFLFKGDRADCEGVARLTVLDGTVLTLGVASSVQVSEVLHLREGEARLAAGPSGSTVRIDAGRDVQLESGGVAIVRAGVAAHLYLEQGRGSWVVGSFGAKLREGQGVEALRLSPEAIRLSADPTNAEAVELAGLENQVEHLEPGQSSVGAQRSVGWALRESTGDVRVERGFGAEPLELRLLDRDRVRLGAGDRVLTADGASVAIVRSASIQLEGQSALGLASAFTLESGAAEVDAPLAMAWSFGKRVAELSGRAKLEVHATGLRVLGIREAVWSGAGGTVELAPEAELLVAGTEEGWQLSGWGQRVAGADGWSAELPEFVGLGIRQVGDVLELTGVGRRSWQIGEGVEVALQADGSARFANGAAVALPAGGVAQVDSGSLAPVESSGATQSAPPRFTLANRKRVTLGGPVSVRLGYDAVQGARSRVTLADADEVLLVPALGDADFALAQRSGDRIDLPAGDVQVVRAKGVLEVRVANRVLVVEADAPQVTVRVLNARGDWDVSATGLRRLNFPTATGGVLRVSSEAVRWAPQ